jgi:hypothetical protein
MVATTPRRPACDTARIIEQVLEVLAIVASTFVVLGSLARALVG